MPELPEVEQIRRSLEPAVLGGLIASAKALRRDVIVAGNGSTTARIRPGELLAGSRIARLHRHGKNLAIIADTGKVICIHLGMSGQLRWIAGNANQPTLDHVHVMWTVRRGRSTGRLIFRDPRRFGGLWLFDSLEQLMERRLGLLGPDALTIDGRVLGSRLNGSSRAIKAALLDQAVIAGVGNIYADESLFRAGIHPATPARRLAASHLDALAAEVVGVLQAAIDSGGSTIRSYVDSTGQGGTFADQHMVYGRAGQPCLACGVTLRHTTICQRTTTFCTGCQPRRLGSKKLAHLATTQSYPQSTNRDSGFPSESSGVVGVRSLERSRPTQRRGRVLVSSSSQ
jgi:formamidopyrimidine-DNA glycosylase